MPPLHARVGAILLALATGCTGGDDGSAGTTADSGFCATAPVSTYESFGSGFLTENCQTCHASTAPNRHDAPAEVTFDDAAQAWQWADRILARATGAEVTMPPMGGTTDDDRYLLEVWLSCATSGT